MSKPDKITLEYIGPEGRCFRDVPAMKPGETVVVDERIARSLIRTKHFKVKKPKQATAKPAGKE